MQTHLQIKQDLYRLCGVTSDTVRSDILNAAKLAIQRAQTRFVLRGDWSFLEQYQDRVYLPLAARYETGTVAVTLDSKTVTGTSSVWTADMQGDFFRLTTKESYEIREFTSTTALELAIPYQSASATLQTYQILKRFYHLPLNFMRPHGGEAKLTNPGSTGDTVIFHNAGASFRDNFETGRPQWFSVSGNTRRRDYFNTGTVLIATAAGVSTWTISTGTLPTDIVDREARVSGEERGYLIRTRGGATTFTTYDAYVNPSDATNTQAVASNYAITPKETLLIGFSSAPDQRYIFSMPYIKRLPDLILDSDISPIVLAGYEDAFVAACRGVLAQDFRTLLADADGRQGLMIDMEASMADAWLNEQRGEAMKQQASGPRVDRRQVGPSWI